MSTGSHTGFCKQHKSKYYEKKAIFVTTWTQYCRTCGGMGGEYISFDPSAAGVGLGSGHMLEFEYCKDCIEMGKCPRCDAMLDSLTTEDGKTICWNCHWDEEGAEHDVNGEYCLPPEPECNCFEANEEAIETYAETYRELEVDLGNDPDRQQRQDDANNALMYLIGSNDDNDEGD